MSFFKTFTTIRGLKGEVVCGKGEIVPRPCCKRSRCGTTFQCINGEMENGYCSQQYIYEKIWGIYI